MLLFDIILFSRVTWSYWLDALHHFRVVILYIHNTLLTMSVQSSHSSDGEGSVPETPMIAQSLNRPMMSPPRMLSQQVQLEWSGLTRSPLNNLTSNNDGHNHIDNDTNDHGFFTVRSLDRSTLLNFPAMQQSHPLLNNSVDASTTPTHLSLYLNRETPRRGRRRRATSFDALMPIPRIALKPRF